MNPHEFSTHVDEGELSRALLSEKPKACKGRNKCERCFEWIKPCNAANRCTFELLTCSICPERLGDERLFERDRYAEHVLQYINEHAEQLVDVDATAVRQENEMLKAQVAYLSEQLERANSRFSSSMRSREALDVSAARAVHQLKVGVLDIRREHLEQFRKAEQWHQERQDTMKYFRERQLELASRIEAVNDLVASAKTHCQSQPAARILESTAEPRTRAQKKRKNCQVSGDSS